MKKNGFTIVEIIVSVGLISVVMLLLFQLLGDLEYQESHSSFAKENQVNRATVIRAVQNDLMSKELEDISITTQANSREIDFRFKNSLSSLIVFKDRISYNGEVWLLESGNEDAYFNLDGIVKYNPEPSCSYILNVDTNGDGICNVNCDRNNNGIVDQNEITPESATYRHCPAYKLFKIIIPVVHSDNKDNNIDDFEFYYIGK